MKPTGTPLLISLAFIAALVILFQLTACGTYKPNVKWHYNTAGEVAGIRDINTCTQDRTDTTFIHQYNNPK